MHLSVNNDRFKPILNKVSNAFKRLYKKGNYKPSDLFKVPEFKELIDHTSSVISYSLEDNKLSNEMTKRFEDDIFLFSGLKTHAQLSEASKLLLTEDKKIKSFAAFSRDVEQIKESYNRNYLEAEYEYAVGTVQMAERWESFSDDDRFALQYRTAGDGAVRPEHQVLDKITLPKNNEFWKYYTPKNGWRCRCTAVQVLKRKYKISDTANALKLGEKATTKIGKSGKNTLEIFRFNPAKKKVMFPPKHPYHKHIGSNVVKQHVNEEIKQKDKNESTPKHVLKPALLAYEKRMKIQIDRKFFKDFVTENVRFTEVARRRNQGAHYSPATKTVVIPTNNRTKFSKWKAESIVYHEFGHAADWIHGMRTSKVVKDLMKKYRELYRKDDHKLFKELDRKWRNKVKEFYQHESKDKIEKLSAFTDTLMSLDPRYGYGHTKVYFKGKGKKEAEFIAHAFENKFSENDVFKELAPDLYHDMRKLIDQLRPKQK